MAHTATQTKPDDEVILRVRYNTFKGWFVPVAVICLLAFFYDAPYTLARRGDYLETLILVFGIPITLAVSASQLFMKEIVFYHDRVVKYWYFVGQRSISYSRAKLIIAPGWVQTWTWPGKALTISEIDAMGSVLKFQISIHINLIATPAQDRKKVESLCSYLVGIDDKSKLYDGSRRFEKNSLPKEILC